jgi:hypothetical protein
MPDRLDTEEQRSQMNFVESRKGDYLRRRATIVVATIAFVFAATGAVASPASAANSGQIDAWGEQGTEPEQLFFPLLLGVDPTDGPGGSVYVMDFTEAEDLQIKKFSASGDLLATSAPILHEGFTRLFQGIAVDPAENRLYVLPFAEGEDPVTGEAAAQPILVYSTVPDEGELVPPEGGPTTLPVPPATGVDALDNPQGIVLDPASHDLVISAGDRSGHFVLQRIHTAGAGSVGPRYTESSGGAAELDDAVVAGLTTPSLAADLAVGPDGTTYILTGRGGGAADEENVQAWTLPPGDFSSSTPTAVPGFAAAANEEEREPLVAGNQISGLFAFGPQVAISEDGGTLYWKEKLSSNESGATEPGNYLVRGYSLPDAHTAVLFGGTGVELECTVQSKTAALAAAGDELFILDQGTIEAAESPYGVHVLRFGPGGSECPGPSAAIKLKVGPTEVSTVSAGTTVTLDGSDSELGTLRSPALDSLIWKVEGPGGTFEQTVPSTDPSPFTLDHPFNQAGDYTVRLLMKLSGTGYPVDGTSFAAKAKTLEVTGGGGPPTPAVTALNPTSGSTAGGNQVEITGTDLTGATKVEFGTTVVNAPFTENTATKIKLNAPAHTAGTVNVLVTTPGGTSANPGADDYTYNAPTPTPAVTALNPTHGAAAGGNVVTITGTDLTGATEVKFGATQGTEVVVENATTVKAKAPAGTAGATVDVRVTTPGGTSTNTAADNYLYDAVLRKLTVAKSGSGSGSVSSNPAGINCGVTCETEFANGTVVTLTATSAAGSTFTGWSGGVCSGVGNCVVSMTAAKAVTANFDVIAEQQILPPSVTPPPGPPATPKPVKCRKGFKKKRVRGRVKCVRKHAKGKGRPARAADRAELIFDLISSVF